MHQTGLDPNTMTDNTEQFLLNIGCQPLKEGNDATFELRQSLPGIGTPIRIDGGKVLRQLDPGKFCSNVGSVPPFVGIMQPACLSDEFVDQDSRAAIARLGWLRGHNWRCCCCYCYSTTCLLLRWKGKRGSLQTSPQRTADDQVDICPANRS